MDTDMATKWGIVSTGKISSDFVLALKTLPTTEHIVAAVAASSLSKAQEFASKYGIQNAFGNYKDLAKAPDIDVVYIGAINPLHYSICKEMLLLGKNVLCEKPLCMKTSETKELIKIANEKQLFLMEAIWSRCFPMYKKLKEILESQILGEIVHVQAKFGVEIFQVPRLIKKELGGGTILDLGVYLIQFALLTIGRDIQSMTGFGKLNTEGVDEDCVILLDAPGGKSATLIAHSRFNLKNAAYVFGTKGILEICAPFWCPTKLQVTQHGKVLGVYESTLQPSSDQFNFLNSAGLAYEAQEVRNCLMKGLKESPLITHDESIQISEMQTKLMADLGVSLSEEN